MSIYTQIQKNISNYYKMLTQQSSAKYVKESLLGVSILISLFAGYFIHNYYVEQREQRAYGALVEVVESFEKSQHEMLAAESDQDKEKINNAWQDTEILINALYKDNMGSYLAPYFLMFKAQIVLERDKDIDASRKILEEALQQIPKDSELYSLFDVKRIKMGLDASDDKVVKQSLDNLIALSKNEKGQAFEESSYLLGLYYVSQGNLDQAREVWGNLLKFVDKKLLIQSPWVKLAEEKLSSIKHV